jgi:hypothetical protein
MSTQPEQSDLLLTQALTSPNILKGSCARERKSAADLIANETKSAWEQLSSSGIQITGTSGSHFIDLLLDSAVRIPNWELIDTIGVARHLEDSTPEAKGLVEAVAQRVVDRTANYTPNIYEIYLGTIRARQKFIRNLALIVKSVPPGRVQQRATAFLNEAVTELLESGPKAVDDLRQEGVLPKANRHTNRIREKSDGASCVSGRRPR